MKSSSSGSEGPGPAGAKPCEDKGYDKGGPMARGRAALPEPAPRRRRDDDNDESWIQVQLQTSTTPGGKDGDEPWLLERYGNVPQGGKDAWYQHGAWSVRRHTKHRVLDFRPLHRGSAVRIEDLTMERVTVRFHLNGEKTVSKDRWLWQQAAKAEGPWVGYTFFRRVDPTHGRVVGPVRSGGKGPAGKGDCQTKEELLLERLERSGSASSSGPRDESWAIFPILESNLDESNFEASSSDQAKRSSSLEEIPPDFTGGNSGWEGVVEKMIIRRAQNNLQLASQGGGVDEAPSDHSAPRGPAPKLKLNVKIEVERED